MRISDWCPDVCSPDRDAYPQGIARVRFDPPAGRSAIRNGLDWLLASAAGQSMPLVEFHDGAELSIGPHERAPLDPAQARDVLRMLIDLRARGLRRPLPFAPSSGWELYRAPSLRSEEQTSEIPALMRLSSAVFCLKKNHKQARHNND